MNMPHEPEINAWYRDPFGKTFQVVAIDENDKTVELQHFGGELEGLPLSAWYGIELEAIDPPEDWTGPFDDLLRDDLGDTGFATHPEDWNGPWEEIEREH